MERKGTTDIPLGPEGQEWSARVPIVLLTRSAQLRPLLGAMLILEMIYSEKHRQAMRKQRGVTRGWEDSKATLVGKESG